jgi:hypothetical protein
VLDVTKYLISSSCISITAEKLPQNFGSPAVILDRWMPEMMTKHPHHI